MEAIISIKWPKIRSWGWYATLIRTSWFCLKVLRFNPNSSLSLQRHEHRTELWLFIKAKGKIEYRPNVYTEPPNRVTRIWVNQPFEIWKIEQGWWHRFTAFDKPVYAIELQYGKKVTEKDIERKE